MLFQNYYLSHSTAYTYIHRYNTVIIQWCKTKCEQLAFGLLSWIWETQWVKISKMLCVCVLYVWLVSLHTWVWKGRNITCLSNQNAYLNKGWKWLVHGWLYWVIICAYWPQKHNFKSRLVDPEHVENYIVVCYMSVGNFVISRAFFTWYSALYFATFLFCMY